MPKAYIVFSYHSITDSNSASPTKWAKSNAWGGCVAFCLRRWLI